MLAIPSSFCIVSITPLPVEYLSMPIHLTSMRLAPVLRAIDMCTQHRLLKCLCSMPEKTSVIVSGYPSSVYDNVLPGWRSKKFQAMTRGGVRIEKIWMNYPEEAHTRMCSPEKTTARGIILSEKRNAGSRNLQPYHLRRGWR